MNKKQKINANEIKEDITIKDQLIGTFKSNNTAVDKKLINNQSIKNNADLKQREDPNAKKPVDKALEVKEINKNLNGKKNSICMDM